MSMDTTTQTDILNQLSHLKVVLQERYGVTRIGIFGSVARDEAASNSDIDVVVHMMPNLLQRVRLKAELESVFGKPVDVIRYQPNMNPYLKARIDQEALYV